MIITKITILKESASIKYLYQRLTVLTGYYPITGQRKSRFYFRLLPKSSHSCIIICRPDVGRPMWTWT